MALSKKIAVVGVVTWLVSYFLTKTNRAARQQESSLQSERMTTWEGEGGNLPPPKTQQIEPALP